MKNKIYPRRRMVLPPRQQARISRTRSLERESFMKNSKEFHRSGMCIVLSLLLLLMLPSSARPQTHPDFSGMWKQDNDRCQPKRNGQVTLRIEHHGPELKVETTILRGSQTPRRAVQQYTTDGNVSVSTGV